MGIWNVVRFNWPMYVSASAAALSLFILWKYTGNVYLFAAGVASVTILITSLLVSFYIYDLSGLYKLNWLDRFIDMRGEVVNIHAGFDETSEILRHKYPGISLKTLDFYDPIKHSEPSIRRARRLYPEPRNTVKIDTTDFQIPENSVDNILVIFSAHEIRNKEEREVFFREIRKIAKPAAKIIVTEHLRDWKNFMAYTIGFLHFYSKPSWRNTFLKAGLQIEKEFSVTPFITTFICSKNGTAS